MNVAQAEHHARRTAHPGIAMNHHSLSGRPRVHELADLTRLIFGKQNVGWFASLGEVVKVQAKHRRESRGDSSRHGIGVGDGNADLSAARLVALGFLARENDELRSQCSPSRPAPYFIAPPPRVVIRERLPLVKLDCPARGRHCD